MSTSKGSAKLILAINAGSSSVKVSVFLADSGKTNGEDPTQLADIAVGGISAPPATLKYTRRGEKVQPKESPSSVDDQKKAFRFILDLMINDTDVPELSHTNDIDYVCHRIVHGGDYGKVQVIDSNTYHRIEELSDLAPL